MPLFLLLIVFAGICDYSAKAKIPALKHARTNQSGILMLLEIIAIDCDCLLVCKNETNFMRVGWCWLLDSNIEVDSGYLMGTD